MIRSVEEHGWPAVRLAAFERDHGCVAVQPRIFGRDVAPDLCRGGQLYIIRWDDIFQLEFDHVKEALAAGVKASDDEAHGVMACAWHHRLGKAWRTDTKEHRAVLRAWLAKHYPEVWGKLDATS